MIRSSLSAATFILAALAASPGAASAETVVKSISDLPFTYSGGASEEASTPDSLSIRTSKNSRASASLPASYTVPEGKFISLTLQLTVSNAVETSPSGSFISLSFAGSGHLFGVRLDVASLSNGLIFEETGDLNLAKHDTLAELGTTTHTCVFTLDHIGAGEMLLTFSSPTLIPEPRTAKNDVSPLGTEVFDSFTIGFVGSAWNDSRPVVTISGLEINTNAQTAPAR